VPGSVIGEMGRGHSLLNIHSLSQGRSKSFFPSENEQCTVVFVEVVFLINLCEF
jgi:hypothetical protein